MGGGRPRRGLNELLALGIGLGLSVGLLGLSPSGGHGQEGIAGTPADPTPIASARSGLLWRFEGEGALLYDAAGHPTGWACGARRVPGRIGRALRFDGVDDFVLIDTSGVGEGPRWGLTVALWVRLDRPPELTWRNDFRYLLAKPALHVYSLLLEKDLTVSASVYVGGERRWVRSRTRLPVGEWTHVAFSYEGRSGLVRLYLNGRLEAEKRGSPGPIDDSEEPLFVGSGRARPGQGGLRGFAGVLDELHLYPMALSPQAIAALARPPDGQAPTKPARLPRSAQLAQLILLVSPPRSHDDGRATVARVVVRFRDDPHACPEVAYVYPRPDRPPSPSEPGPAPEPGAALNAVPAHPEGLSWTLIELPPGTYSLSVDRGAGFTTEPVDFDVKLAPNEQRWMRIELERRLHPRARGYFAADLHLHTRASGDGVTPIREAVWAQLTADLDVVTLTDHNTALSHALFAQEAERLGVPYLLGQEITTPDWGHFNAFPLRPGTVVPVARGKLPSEYFMEARTLGATFIQVDHPFWGTSSGYFWHLEEPGFDWGFDGVEVLNGWSGGREPRWIDLKAIQTLFEWWTQGRRLVATAGSDDHNTRRLKAQIGLPRTYVYVPPGSLDRAGGGGGLTTEAWVTALRAGQAFVTSGPLVYLSAQGQPPGAVLKPQPDGSLVLNVEVESLTELSEVTIWHNGQAVLVLSLEGRKARLRWRTRAEAGWYAATVKTVDGGFALTNPIWIEPLERAADEDKRGQDGDAQ